jgi:hypothetical protein
LESGVVERLGISGLGNMFMGVSGLQELINPVENVFIEDTEVSLSIIGLCFIQRFSIYDVQPS